VNKFLLAFSILLCCLQTTHWWLNLWGCYDIYMNVDRGLPTEFAFANQAEIKSVVRLAFYEIQVWFGDAVLVWRLYLVCGRKLKYIAVPVVTCIGLLTCSCFFIQTTSKLDLTKPETLVPVRDWSIGAFSLSLFENIYCTSMIAFHIWRGQRDVRYVSQSNLNPILRIFVESAGLWTIVALATFIAYLKNNYVFYTLYYMANPIMGICFCMITVRLNLRTRQRTAPSAQYSGNSSTTAGPGSKHNTPRKVAFDPDYATRSEDSGPIDLSKIPLSPIRYPGNGENLKAGNMVTVNHVV